MSQVKHESFDDGCFVQLDQPDEVPDQQEAQQQREQPQFGLHQNPFDWGDWPVAVDTGNTRNYDDELKEHKLMIANLEVPIFYFGCGRTTNRWESNPTPPLSHSNPLPYHQT
jgi:hypothetical protein